MILTAVMTHPRELIRQAVVATLVAANTAAGARVKSTRIEPIKKSQLPAIAVYTLSEDTQTDTEHFAPRELTRDLKLEIAAWVEHKDSYPVDDAMDDIAAQIEAAMDANRYIAAALSITAVDATTDQLTITAHGLGTGDGPAELDVSAASIPGGLAPGALYHVIVVDADHVQLAGSLADAVAGTAIDITSAGSGPLQLFVSRAAESVLESTSIEVVDGDGHSDPMVGVVTLTYGVMYRTAPAVTGGNIADFLRVDARHQLAGGVADTVPGEDLFNVRSP